MLSNRRLSLLQQFQVKKGALCMHVATSGVFPPCPLRVCLQAAPLGMWILKALPGFYSSVRGVPGMGLAVYLAMHVFNFVYSPFLPFYGYASSSSSPTGSS